MNNLYHKAAVASVGIALSLALGANKEAKAATFTLTATSSYLAVDNNQDGLADWYYGSVPLPVGIREPIDYREKYFREEYRAFYEFNIDKLSLAPNTVISSAILEASVNSIEWYGLYFRLQAYGYRENEKANGLALFDAGEYLDQEFLDFILYREPKGITTFNVFPFIDQSIKNNNSFAGFGIRFLDQVPYRDEEGYITLNSRNARLTITTVDVAEPVPEPTTIFGSAIALGLGGWLKRKKSSLQNRRC